MRREKSHQLIKVFDQQLDQGGIAAGAGDQDMEICRAIMT
jgi:hypothetical protein